MADALARSRRDPTWRAGDVCSHFVVLGRSAELDLIPLVRFGSHSSRMVDSSGPARGHDIAAFKQ